MTLERYLSSDALLTVWAVRVLLSVTVTWLLAAAAALCLQGASAAVRHRVWALSTVAALALPGLVLALPEVGMGWIRLPPSAAEMQTDMDIASSVDRVQPKIIEQRPADVATFDKGRASPKHVSRRVQAKNRSREIASGREDTRAVNSVDWSWLGRFRLLAAWAVPATTMLVWLVVAVLSARRTVRRAAAIDDEECLALLARLAANAGGCLAVELRESKEIVSPVCVGWWRPTILLPLGWREWPANQLQAALAHELAHATRGDVAWQLLARGACAVYWFHPPAWLAAWRMRVEREAACDDWALASGCTGAEYARVLLAIASQLGLGHRSSPEAAAAMAAGRRFERRIRAVLSPHRRRGPLGRRAAMSLSVAAIALAVLAGVVSPFAPSTPNAKAFSGESASQPRQFDVVGYATDQINAVAISSDGKLVAGGGMDKAVKIWNLQSGELLHRIDGCEKPIRTVAFQPGTSLLAAGGNDLAVRIFDASKGVAYKTLRGALPTVQSIAFSPNGRLLAACTFSQTAAKKWAGYVLVWDVESAELLRKVDTQTNGEYRGVAFSPDGHLLAAAFDELKGESVASGVKLWDTATWNLKATLLRDRGLSVSVAFSADGRRIASGGGYVLVKDGRVATGEIKLWDVDSGKLIKTLNRPADGGYLAVAFSPDGTAIAAQGFGPVVDEANTRKVVSETTLWNIGTAARLWNVRLPFCGDVSPPAFTPDGKKLIVCDSESVRVLDARSGETLRELMKVTLTQLPAKQSRSGAISGQVVSEQGEGVRSAIVWLVPSRRNNSTPRAVITDDQGRFEFKEIGPGGFRLAVIAEDKSYGGMTRFAAGNEPIDEQSIKLTVAPSAELKLRVTDRKGQPIEGAEVAGIAWRRGSSDWFWFPLEQLIASSDRPHSDANGELTVKRLPSESTVKVRLRHPQFARNILETLLPMPDGVPREVVLPRGGPLVIQAVEAASGKPATDATVSITGIGDGLDFFDERVDSQGRLTVRVARAKHLTMHASHPTLVPREWFTFRDWDQETDITHEVRFELVRRAKISGRVIDDSGKPAAGAWVSLAVANKVQDRAKTGEDGRYSIEGPEGAATLELMPNGPFYNDTKQPVRVTLDADHESDAPDLVARRVPSLHGVVLLPDGKPAAQALVLDETNFSSNSALTDEQGRFELPGDSSYQHGVVHVSASHLTERLSGDATTDFAGMLRGDTLRVELQSEASIHGRLVGTDGKPIEGVRVELQSWARNDRGSVGGTAGACYTDASGEYRFAGVSRALSYRILVRDASGFEVLAAKAMNPEADVVEVNLPSLASTKDLVTPSAPAKAPELECAAWVGEPIALEALRGKVVLLDFWATWCGPCVRELPAVERLHELYAEKGLVVVGIHHNSVPEQEVRQFVQEHGLRYSIGLDAADGATCGRYGVHAFPTKVLIGRDGRLRMTELSGNTIATVRREILYGGD